MGNGLMCATTPKTGVAQGDANTLKNRCATTTPPKGGWVVVALRHLFARGVVRDLVPIVPFLSMRGTARPSVAFSLPKKIRGVI